MKVTETQGRVLKALNIGLKATYVDCGGFSHAYWNRRDRQQCTQVMKALKKKGLVDFVKAKGAVLDHDIIITEAGKAAIQ